MRMESEARNPSPVKTPARPPLGCGGWPRLLRVVNWYSWLEDPAWLCAVTCKQWTVTARPVSVSSACLQVVRSALCQSSDAVHILQLEIVCDWNNNTN